jgi:hypothetical protein
MFTELYGGARSIIAGGGTATYAPAGNINVAVTTVGSSATNTTQTLASYTLPATTLQGVGDGIVVQAFGRFAGNAAPKTLQLNVGGMNINSGSVTQSGSSWMLTAEVFKSAASAQQGFLTAQLGTVFTAPKSTSDTSTDTGTIAITVQCLDASAAQSNVLIDGLVVEYFG